MQRTCCGVTLSSDEQCSARSCWQMCCSSLRLSNSSRLTSMQTSCSSRSTSEFDSLLVGSACLYTGFSTSKRISQAAYMHSPLAGVGLCSWPALACSCTDHVRHNAVVNGHLPTAHC